MSYNNIGNYGLVARDALIVGAQIDNELKIPRLATLPSAAYKGDFAYRTTDDTLHYYNGSAWVALTSGSLSGYVPYTGATANLDLGTRSLLAASETISDATNSVAIAPASITANANTLQTVKLDLKSAATGAGKWWSVSHTEGETSLKFRNVNSGSVPLQINSDNSVQVNTGLIVGATAMFGADGMVLDTSGPSYLICSNGDDPNVNNRFFIGCSDNTRAEIGCYSGQDGFWKNICLQSGGGRVSIGNLAPATTLDVTGSIRATDIVFVGDGTVSAPSLSFYNQNNTGVYRSAPNTVGIAGNGVQIASIGTGGITFTTQSTTSFKVTTNSGGWDAFQIYSTGADTVAANTVGYAALLQPLNGGRFVVPSASSNPAGSIANELYSNTDINALMLRVGGAWNAIGPTKIAHLTNVQFATGATLGPFGTKYYATFGQSFSNATFYIWSETDPTLASSDFYVGYSTINGNRITGAVLDVKSSHPVGYGGVSPLLYDVGIVNTIGVAAPITFQLYVYSDFATAIPSLSGTFTGAPQRDITLTLHLY